MKLFIVEGNIVRPTTEVLLIHPFSVIWDRAEDKGQAIREFSYIEFMCSMKRSNPFKGYDKTQRKLKIIEKVFNGESYAPDVVIDEAMTVYEDFQYNASPSLRFYRAALKGAEKLEDFFTVLDMTERNNRDQPLYKPGDVTRALKDTFDVLKTLRALEEKVAEEIYEATKTKGNKEINPFER